VKKFEGDAENTPLCDILKALGYAYKDCRYHNPKLGLKEIYKDDPEKDLVMEEDILFVGGACETSDWLIETGQLDGEKQRSWSVIEAYEARKAEFAKRAEEASDVSDNPM